MSIGLKWQKASFLTKYLGIKLQGRVFKSFSIHIIIIIIWRRKEKVIFFVSNSTYRVDQKSWRVEFRLLFPRNWSEAFKKVITPFLLVWKKCLWAKIICILKCTLQVQVTFWTNNLSQCGNDVSGLFWAAYNSHSLQLS